MRTFKTPKGTELPLRDMKGKDYLDVPYRVQWMREEHQDWGIETSFLTLNETIAIAHATIRDASGRILAQGTKTETPQGFADYVEKAETGAVGRALALCGYGTQFAQELCEEDRIVDSPKERPISRPGFGVVSVSSDPGAYVIKFGQKYRGKRLDEIGPHDAVNYGDWLKKSAAEKNIPLSTEALETVNAIEAFAQSRTTKGDKK